MKILAAIIFLFFVFSCVSTKKLESSFKYKFINDSDSILAAAKPNFDSIDIQIRVYKFYPYYDSHSSEVSEIRLDVKNKEITKVTIYTYCDITNYKVENFSTKNYKYKNIRIKNISILEKNKNIWYKQLEKNNILKIKKEKEASKKWILKGEKLYFSGGVNYSFYILKKKKFRNYTYGNCKEKLEFYKYAPELVYVENIIKVLEGNYGFGNIKNKCE